MGARFSLVNLKAGNSIFDFLRDEFSLRVGASRFEKFSNAINDLIGRHSYFKQNTALENLVEQDPSQGGAGDDVIVGDRQVITNMRLDEAILVNGQVAIDFNGNGTRLTTMGRASDGSGQVLRIRNGFENELSVTVKIHGTDYSQDYTISGKTQLFVIAPQERGTFKVEFETGKTHVKAGNPGTFRYGQILEIDTSDDTLFGNGGNDTLIGGLGNDTLDGGEGSDTASYADDAGSVTANLFSGTANDGSGGTDTLISIENIVGSEFADRLEGNGLVNTLSGNGGDDTIYAYNGNDVIHGGEGNDTLSGGNDDDIINGDAGNDILRGDAGNDEIYGGTGDDQLLGHAGNDTLHGGIGNDDLRDGDGDDTIFAGQGNDVIYGGAGNDIYHGEDGDDFIQATSGVNTLYGGEGVDTLYGGSDSDTIYGDAGNDSIQGFAGNDEIHGGTGDDYLRGNAGNDQIYGGDNNDVLLGEDGNDELYGEDGNDVFNAGIGDDVLHGGQGSDHLIGGAGADTYVFQADTAFNGWDHIYGFSPAEGDVIDISDVLSNYNPLDHLLTDFVNLYEDGNYTYLHVDADGGGNNFVRVAAIVNVTGLGDVDTLAADGTLIIA